jgi:hypothetical protein
VHGLDLDEGRGPLPTERPRNLIAIVKKAAPFPVENCVPVLKRTEVKMGAGNPGTPFNMFKEKL